MELSIENQIKEVVEKLEAVKMVFGVPAFEKILAAGGEVAQKAMQNEAPESGYTHIIKDGGGKTKRVRSGNLKKSIQVFKHKNAKKNVSALVGPVTSARSKIKGLSGGPKVSRAKRAFYWRFNYYGAYNAAPNRFIDKARTKSAGAVLQAVKSGANKYLDKKLNTIFR